MRTIKFQAGDKVFWLSSDGFKEGIIKSVHFTDEITTPKNTLSEKPHRRTVLTYRLWSKDSCDIYQGQEIPEQLIFASYKDMVEHYVKKGKV